MPTPRGAPKATLRLRTSQFRRHAASKRLRTDEEIATRAGLNRATVNRVLRGEAQPGPAVIAALLLAFPECRFEDIFEVIPGRRPAAPRDREAVTTTTS